MISLSGSTRKCNSKFNRELQSKLRACQSRYFLQSKLVLEIRRDYRKSPPAIKNDWTTCATPGTQLQPFLSQNLRPKTYTLLIFSTYKQRHAMSPSLFGNCKQMSVLVTLVFHISTNNNKKSFSLFCKTIFLKKMFIYFKHF